MPASTVTGWAHADKHNIGQFCSLACRFCHHSGCLSPRTPSKQRSEQRPDLLCTRQQWMAERTPSQRTEARAAPTPVVPANTVAGRTLADQANRSQSSSLKFCARHLSGCLSPRRPSEHRSDQRPHLLYPPPQWMAEPTPTERTDARAEPSAVVPAPTVAG